MSYNCEHCLYKGNSECSKRVVSVGECFQPIPDITQMFEMVETIEETISDLNTQLIFLKNQIKSLAYLQNNTEI